MESQSASRALPSSQNTDPWSLCVDDTVVTAAEAQTGPQTSIIHREGAR